MNYVLYILKKILRTCLSYNVSLTAVFQSVKMTLRDCLYLRSIATAVKNCTKIQYVKKVRVCLLYNI